MAWSENGVECRNEDINNNSVTMAATGGSDLYLVIAGSGVLIGASLLLLLGPSERAYAAGLQAGEASS